MKNGIKTQFYNHSFIITVLPFKPDIKSDNKPENHYLNGHEVGDTYTCEYSCPGGFCTKRHDEAISAYGDSAFWR